MIVANFKMMMNAQDVKTYFEQLHTMLPSTCGHVVFCPSFTHLAQVKEYVQNTAWGLGAQNMAEQDVPNFTGEIGVKLLAEQNVHYVILGHAERRANCKETNKVVASKVKLALQHGFTPIVCIGEGLACKEAGRTHTFLKRQISAVCQGLPSGSKIILAYEPIYAIGAPTSPKPEDIAPAMQSIQKIMQAFPQVTYSILYGGSASAKTAKEILEVPGVSGLLLGRAGTKVEEFVSIVRTYESK